jgi:hypothetical protein
MKRSISIALLSAMFALCLGSQVYGQPRQRMMNTMIDSAANAMVSEIQNDSCAEFASMLQSRKSGGSSKPSRTGGMMKSDPAARSRFVNKVAGPLVNKMIDCDMLPSK